MIIPSVSCVHPIPARWKLSRRPIFPRRPESPCEVASRQHSLFDARGDSCYTYAPRGDATGGSSHALRTGPRQAGAVRSHKHVRRQTGEAHRPKALRIAERETAEGNMEAVIRCQPGAVLGIPAREKKMKLNRCLFVPIATMLVMAGTPAPLQAAERAQAAPKPKFDGGVRVRTVTAVDITSTVAAGQPAATVNLPLSAKAVGRSGYVLWNWNQNPPSAALTTGGVATPTKKILLPFMDTIKGTSFQRGKQDAYYASGGQVHCRLNGISALAQGEVQSPS